MTPSTTDAAPKLPWHVTGVLAVVAIPTTSPSVSAPCWKS